MTELDLTDAALDGMDDTKLLEVMESLGLDTATVSCREDALAAIKAKRDADAAAKAPESATASASPAPETGSGESGLTLDTTADEAESEDPPVPQRSIRTAHVMVADAVKAAAGDPVLHAALHNFETALADFRRAADDLAGRVKLDPRSEVGGLVEDVRRFF